MSSSGEEEDMETRESGLTEYEKERLERIQRNRDILASLHVQEVATALESFGAKKATVMKGKGKEKADLNVYQRRSTRLSTLSKTPTKIVDWSSSSSAPPSDSESDFGLFSSGFGKRKKSREANEVLKVDFPEEQQDVEYEPSGESDSEEPDEEDEPDDHDLLTKPNKKPKEGKTARSTRKRAMPLKSRSKVSSNPLQFPNENDTDNEDLQKALKLSMGDDEARGEPCLRSAGNRGTTGQKGKKRLRDLKFMESDIDDFFFSIVGNSEGNLSLTHLEIAAAEQNFVWTEEELQDMIDIFDENNDGFLTLTEFRRMAERCDMLQVY